jgi:hypothetical protein
MKDESKPAPGVEPTDPERKHIRERAELAAVNRLWQQARKVLAPPKE